MLIDDPAVVSRISAYFDEVESAHQRVRSGPPGEYVSLNAKEYEPLKREAREIIDVLRNLLLRH